MRMAKVGSQDLLCASFEIVVGLDSLGEGDTVSEESGLSVDLPLVSDDEILQVSCVKSMMSESSGSGVRRLKVVRSLMALLARANSLAISPGKSPNGSKTESPKSIGLCGVSPSAFRNCGLSGCGIGVQ